jgi:arylsulfatase A-like enzyme
MRRRSLPDGVLPARSHRLCRLAATVVAAGLVGAWGSGSVGDAGPATPAAATTRPNIVFIVTDDQRVDQLARMPAVDGLARNGIRFTNAYVSNALCCPSRATIISGRYSHSTRVYTNDPNHPLGGWPAFRPSESSTVATWLRSAGYRTGLIGKYMNGYARGTAPPVTPPGWNRWFALTNVPGYYTYKVADNGVFRQFGSRAADYSTDVLGGRAVSFIRDTPAATPLFLYFAPYAPHDPFTPPARYVGTVPVTSSWRPPNFNEADVSDKPAWLRTLAMQDGATLDRVWASQAGTLRAVDDAVQRIVDTLRATGRLQNTLIVFTSDNGLQTGSHRFHRKEAPHRESVRVPLVVRYDPLTRPFAGTTVTSLVENVDYAPTAADAAGVASPGADGRSLLPVLRDPSAPWRSDVLLEHFQWNSPVPTYCGVVTKTHKLVEYATGERELYDLVADPFELESRDGDPAFAGIEASLHARILARCSPPPPGLTLSP